MKASVRKEVRRFIEHYKLDCSIKEFQNKAD